jgi:hypothetical protein
MNLTIGEVTGRRQYCLSGLLATRPYRLARVAAKQGREIRLRDLADRFS